MGPDSHAGAEPAPGAAEAPTMPSSLEPQARAQVGAGSVLADRYRLVRRIGGGGMGSVWESEHLALGNTVAIKLINPSLVDDERARSRFLREARAAATLRGPNVVQIFDHGVHEGVPYIAMELLDGEPLSDRLQKRGRLRPDEVLAIVTQVGRAVAKAHEAGVVHRDLKPENIYLIAGEHGDVAKVLDFGIAKRSAEVALGATTSSGTLLGTPYYMSPEQLIDSGLADARADLWSLAVIAYECLIGERPFVAHSMPELAVVLLAEPTPVPSQHGDVPKAFDAWFERATMRDAEARFQGVAELIDALATALRDDVVAVQASTSASPRSEARRRGVLWAALALGGAAAIGGLALASAGAPAADVSATEGATAPRDAAPPETSPTAPAPAVAPAVAPRGPAVVEPAAPTIVESAPAADARRRSSKPPRKRMSSESRDDELRPRPDPRELEP